MKTQELNQLIQRINTENYGRLCEIHLAEASQPIDSRIAGMFHSLTKKDNTFTIKFCNQLSLESNMAFDLRDRGDREWCIAYYETSSRDQLLFALHHSNQEDARFVKVVFGRKVAGTKGHKRHVKRFLQKNSVL